MVAWYCTDIQYHALRHQRPAGSTEPRRAPGAITIVRFSARAKERGAMKVLVLDDYLDIARGSADWSLLGHDAQVRVLQEHLASREARLRELRPFDVVVAMRERTPFPADLLEALPNLRLLVTTGTRNNSIDLAACQRLGITVCAAPGDSSGSAPAELAWGLIL